jgi:MATE family multidrug resistance protein
MLVGAIVLVILMATKDVFALLFNDDEQVVKLTAHVLPFVAFFQIAGKFRFRLMYNDMLI